VSDRPHSFSRRLSSGRRDRVFSPSSMPAFLPSADSCCMIAHFNWTFVVGGPCLRSSVSVRFLDLRQLGLASSTAYPTMLTASCHLKFNRPPSFRRILRCAALMQDLSSLNLKPWLVLNFLDPRHSIEASLNDVPDPVIQRNFPLDVILPRLGNILSIKSFVFCVLCWSPGAQESALTRMALICDAGARGVCGNGPCRRDPRDRPLRAVEAAFL
jgi:hypothetical protein